MPTTDSTNQLIDADPHVFIYDGRQISMARSGGVMSKHFEQGRFYENKMLNYIRSLELSGRYIDVGANIGNHTVYFDIFCASDFVEAFEPFERPARFMEHNRRLNNLIKTTVHRVGLGARIERASNRVGRHTIQFDSFPLDHFAFDNVTLIKADIEGMEAEFLQGARETLRHCKPILFIEARSPSDVSTQEEIINDLGYRRSGRVWNATPTYEWICI